MARIRAAISAKLLAQLREAPDPDDGSVEETIQGAIQATLPTAEVRYSEGAADVTIEIADEEMIFALLGVALKELNAPPPVAAPVRPDTIEATDARPVTASEASRLI